MTIPKYDEIRIPALKHLLKTGNVQLKDFETPLAEHFHLSAEEILQEYESKNAKIFYDRISWALSYLHIAGLVERPKRGLYSISELGRQIELSELKINKLTKQKVAERKKDKQILSFSQIEPDHDQTPQELLFGSYENIRDSIYDDILGTLLSKTPRAFEHLVVSLLEKMGYGGQIKNSGIVTKASNDGGIDGIIKEDILGLGRIHIQAKRYKRDIKIGREEIQKFVGAIAVASSNKGVFITTSSYTKNAIEYANNLNGNTTVILISGEELAKYIYDFNLGMQIDQIFEIKKLDGDYWDAVEDDK